MLYLSAKWVKRNHPKAIILNVNLSRKVQDVVLSSFFTFLCGVSWCSYFLMSCNNWNTGLISDTGSAADIQTREDLLTRRIPARKRKIDKMNSSDFKLLREVIIIDYTRKNITLFLILIISGSLS